jgi:hypothetical protein
MLSHVTFPNVKGYATYAAAVKRGEEVQAARQAMMDREGWSYRWIVLALESGRFVPCVIINNTVPTGPGMFLDERNICMTN